MKKFRMIGLGGLLAVGLVGILFAQTTRVSPVTTITCSAGQFINSLTNTGIFTCATPTNGTVGTGGTYYLATTGNDSNACTLVGAPCLTLSGVLSKLPVVLGGTYTINIADGTYAECLSVQNFITPVIVGTPTLQIIGNNTTPANVVFTGQCSYGGIGTETAGSLLSINGSLLLRGIRVAPSSASLFGVQAIKGTVILDNFQIAGSITNGLGVFHNTVVGIDNAISITNWTNYGVFAGLGGELSHAGGTNTLTFVLTPATLGVSCLRAEINAVMDLEGSGTIVCPGGSNNVASFMDADANGYIFATLASTSVNTSTPAGSQVFQAKHGGGIFLLGTITATNFTNSCDANEAGHADQGAGGRTFTSVGATTTVNTGTCILF